MANRKRTEDDNRRMTEKEQESKETTKRLREEKAKKAEDERHRTVTAETDAAEAEVDRTRKREERLLEAAIKHEGEKAVNNSNADEGMDDTPPTANDDPDDNSFDERFKYDSETEA